MIDHQDELFKDMEAVRKIPIVPTMLEVICQTTGMGFAAIARVTTNRWLACSVRDEVGFGLEEGGELKIETTLCNEIRDSRKLIVVDNVSEDQQYKDHHTPRIYGLQSYISVPIILKDGTFFGTLCAIDSKPAKVKNTKVIATFTMFAELLSFHLESLDILERSVNANIELKTQNKALAEVNNELDTVVYTASHDLKSPVSNIEGLLNALSDTVEQEPLNKQKVRQVIGMMRASVKRFSGTIKDLTTLVEIDQHGRDANPETVDVCEVVEAVKQDLQHLIASSGANIQVECEGAFLLKLSKKNLKSIIYNLLSNAIKYASPERCPEVRVDMRQAEGKTCLAVTDNGLGIPADKKDRIFTIYKRLHDHVEGSGIGLYLVKRIIDKVNGRIMVESEVDKGTTFTLIF